MKKKILIIAIAVLLLVILGIVIIFKSSGTGGSIKEDYIAVFKGDNTEVIHKIYLYKNGDNKYPYKYIYTESVLSKKDKTKWEEKVIKNGTVKNMNEMFSIAKKRDASSEVKYIKDGEIYTFEGFKSIALEWNKKK